MFVVHDVLKDDL